LASALAWLGKISCMDLIEQVDSEQITLHELQMDAEQAGPGTAVIATGASFV
jgi:hypothetical protein